MITIGGGDGCFLRLSAISAMILVPYTSNPTIERLSHARVFSSMIGTSYSSVTRVMDSARRFASSSVRTSDGIFSKDAPMRCIEKRMLFKSTVACAAAFLFPAALDPSDRFSFPARSAFRFLW